ncbi:MAG: transporter [Chlorobiaceae bacterium]|nr:transporter [Chlorobiaceae bacterium]NTV16834.1 transporter [Chlorobiaceae bacterium]
MLKKNVLLILTLFFSGNAYAAHPLITDDTGTQGKGKFQIEINSEFSTDKEQENGLSVKERGGAVGATLSYGISHNIDLVVGMPLQWHTIKEEGMTVADESGIGDMGIELKWRLIEAEEGGMSLALKPGLSIPTGDEHKGLGNGVVSGGVALIATHEGRLGALHCNLGYRLNDYGIEENNMAARNDIWHASLAAEINLTDNFRSVANIGVETNEDITSEVPPVFLIGGLICSIHENLDIDLGLKCGLNEAETDTTFLAGLAARF